MNKTSQRNNQTDVLIPEVIEEIPLEKVIDTTLIKHNVTDSVIAGLKEKYGGMRLRNIDDKESYLEIKEARKEVRKVGILTEKLCKKGREDAIIIQKKWLAKEKEILGKIYDVENPLNTEIEKFDNEVERKELEAARLREEKYINRQSTLSKMGATYDNGSFVLNHISYEVELIKQSDEDMWNDTILPKYKKEFEANEADRVAEEKKRKDDLEKMLADKIELERQQNALREAQAELQKQKDDHERQQRLDQERKDLEARQRKQALIDSRRNKLQSLGMQYTGGENYHFAEITIPLGIENNISDDDWEKLVNGLKDRIEFRKKEESDKLIEEAKKKEEEAVKKALQDAEFKKQQEQQQKELELAQANDRTKWMAFIEQVKVISHSDMKSPMYKRKRQMAKEKIEEIINL